VVNYQTIIFETIAKVEIFHLLGPLFARNNIADYYCPTKENAMVEAIDPKSIGKPVVRCAECDREVEHYNTFIQPDNEVRNVCWECLARAERGFNARRGFSRQSRTGVIPR
jgi:hypothetical protein